MTQRRFVQCDVFSSVATKGNGLAVVVDGAGLADDQMQSFALWTNLAETTFLLPPSNNDADYRVRIFTPKKEMQFAGHPTLGSCAAWLHCGGRPATRGVVRQECDMGIVKIDARTRPLAFAAPPTAVAPLQQTERERILTALDIPPDLVIDSAQLSNGSDWHVLELANAADVLRIDASRTPFPAFKGVGLIGAHPPGSPCAYEVRNVSPSSGMEEDPITGSLNAAIAQWKCGAGRWAKEVVIAQGTQIGRKGRVFVRPEKDAIWIGGDVQILIDGTLEL